MDLRDGKKVGVEEDAEGRERGDQEQARKRRLIANDDNSGGDRRDSSSIHNNGSNGKRVDNDLGAGNIMSTAVEGRREVSRELVISGRGNESLPTETHPGRNLRRSPDRQFLNAVQSVGTHHGWTEAQIMRTVEMKLKDKAREYYGALLPIERPSTMDQMKNRRTY
ncbi:hypothetical protein JTB14_004387 [Gonioctena quinquepunctata]|nr:hypothetical protein JTB14_004387 [Gonioctena quinquepunctata]